MNKKCAICGNNYWIKKSHTKKSFCCSRKCMYKRVSRIYRGKNHHSWKGGRFIAKNGYVMVYLPKHPRSYYNGYALEHVIVAEKKIGRPLLSDECVHHLNHHKTDNRPENLHVTTQFQHKSIHMKERHMREKIEIINRDYRGRIKKGGYIWIPR